MRPIRLLTLFCLGLTFGVPLARAQQQEAVVTIMAKVAGNQDRAEELRSAFIYDQDLLLRFRRGNGRLAREELRVFTVTPAANASIKTLNRFQGKYEKDGKYIEYTERGYTYKDLDLDGELITDFADDFADDKHSRDGISADLFPLTSKEQKKYVFALQAKEDYRGREVYRISFQPVKNKDSDFDGAPWAGEILVDAREYQPALVTTRLAKGIPLLVRTLLGTNVKGIGFKVSYERFNEGLWFPVSYGGEFELKAVFFYKRKMTIALRNYGFQRADVTTRVTFEPPMVLDRVLRIPELQPPAKPPSP